MRFSIVVATRFCVAHIPVTIFESSSLEAKIKFEREKRRERKKHTHISQLNWYWCQYFRLGIVHCVLDIQCHWKMGYLTLSIDILYNRHFFLYPICSSCRIITHNNFLLIYQIKFTLYHCTMASFPNKCTRMTETHIHNSCYAVTQFHLWNPWQQQQQKRWIKRNEMRKCEWMAKAIELYCYVLDNV